MSDVTRILFALEAGDPHAAEQLMPLVYDELRQLAAQRLAQEKPGQTLQATALVHEAYLRIMASQERERREDGANATPPAANFDNRGHFFAAAAEAMRRILIDNARRKGSSKHGGDRQRVSLDVGDAATVAMPEVANPDDLLALDEALTQFEAEEPVKARLVKLRFFAGMTLEDAADLLHISRATAKRHWVFARAWLYGKMNRES